MKPRIRTPQEKKALSLARDRRNGYGERGANSRFVVARHKAKDLRRIRRLENQPLATLALENATSEEAWAEAQLQAVAHAPRKWKKSPDRTLRQHIEGKLARRAETTKVGGRRRARLTYSQTSK